MKNYLKKGIALSTLAILATAFTFQSCKKNDDGPGSETAITIKKLTQSPIEVPPSSYKLNDGSVLEAVEAEIDFEIDDIEGNFIRIANENKTSFLLAQTDEGLSGTAFYFDENEVAYSGTDLTVDTSGFEGEKGFITITGTLKNQDDVSLEIFVSVSAAQLGAGSSSFEVEGTKAFIQGGTQGLGTYTYNQILEINSKYPQVNIIVLTDISGSINDDINVETGRLIREAGYTTHLPSDGDIASGGVDLFTSGLKRTMEAGGKIGVHSWCCYEGVTADKLSMDSPGHDKQLAYFKEMLGETIGPDFYFFTLQAAPFNGIHPMTDAEISKYKLLTE